MIYLRHKETGHAYHHKDFQMQNTNPLGYMDLLLDMHHDVKDNTVQAKHHPEEYEFVMSRGDFEKLNEGSYHKDVWIKVEQ